MNAKEIRLLWDNAQTNERLQWINQTHQNVRFFLNNQMTSDEKDSLAMAGMPDFEINKITPAVEMIKYFVTAKHPRWRAVGRTEDDIDIARVHEALAEYVWDLSKGQAVFGRTIQNSLNSGVGYFHWIVDKDADNGLGEVLLDDLDVEEVFADPKSRDFLLRDASYIGIRKVLPKTHLKRELPQYKAKIDKAEVISGVISEADDPHQGVGSEITGRDISSSSTLTGEEEEFCAFYRVYYKDKIQCVNIFHYQEMSDEQQQQMMQQVKNVISDMQAEMEVAFLEKEQQLNMAVQQGQILPERQKLELKKFKEAQLEELQMAQQSMEQQIRAQQSRIINTVMTSKDWEEEFETNRKKWDELIVNVVPFNKTVIKVTLAVGDQTLEEYTYDERVKEYPVIPIYYIHTGCPLPMAFTSMLIGKQREINKGHQIVLHNANVGSALRWIYEEGSIDENLWENYSSSSGALLPYRKGFEPPKPVVPASINNAFITLVQESKSDMDDITGMRATQRGDGNSMHQTHSGMLAQDEFGTRRVKQWMVNMIDPALDQVGLVFKQLSQVVYTTPKVFRIVNRNNGEIEKHELNQYKYSNDGKLAEIAMRYDTAQFDVKYVAASSLPVNRWAEIEEYFKWYQAGVIDDIEFIKKSEISDKDDLIERHSMYARLKSKIESMEQEMKKIRGANETLEGQIIQAGIRDKVIKGQMQDYKTRLESEAAHKVMNKKEEMNAHANQREEQRQLNAKLRSMDLDEKERNMKNDSGR